MTNSSSSSNPNVRKVKCPQCGAPAVFSSENPARPFCSERCKLIDLGQWANEDFKIPAQQNPPLDELPEADSGEDYHS